MSASELVERLEKLIVDEVLDGDMRRTVRAAAARLAELERENARLREALKPFAAHASDEVDYYPDDELLGSDWLYTEGSGLTHAHLRRARAALTPEGRKP